MKALFIIAAASALFTLAAPALASTASIVTAPQLPYAMRLTDNSHAIIVARRGADDPAGDDHGGKVRGGKGGKGGLDDGPNHT